MTLKIRLSDGESVDFVVNRFAESLRNARWPGAADEAAPNLSHARAVALSAAFAAVMESAREDAIIGIDELAAFRKRFRAAVRHDEQHIEDLIIDAQVGERTPIQWLPRDEEKRVRAQGAFASTALAWTAICDAMRPANPALAAFTRIVMTRCLPRIASKSAAGLLEEVMAAVAQHDIEPDGLAAFQEQAQLGVTVSALTKPESIALVGLGRGLLQRGELKAEEPGTLGQLIYRTLGASITTDQGELLMPPIEDFPEDPIDNVPDPEVPIVEEPGESRGYYLVGSVEREKHTRNFNLLRSSVAHKGAQLTRGRPLFCDSTKDDPEDIIRVVNTSYRPFIDIIATTPKSAGARMGKVVDPRWGGVDDLVADLPESYFVSALPDVPVTYVWSYVQRTRGDRDELLDEIGQTINKLWEKNKEKLEKKVEDKIEEFVEEVSDAIGEDASDVMDMVLPYLGRLAGPTAELAINFLHWLVSKLVDAFRAHVWPPVMMTHTVFWPQKAGKAPLSIVSVALAAKDDDGVETFHLGKMAKPVPNDKRVKAHHRRGKHVSGSSTPGWRFEGISPNPGALQFISWFGPSQDFRFADDFTTAQGWSVPSLAVPNPAYDPNKPILTAPETFRFYPETYLGAMLNQQFDDGIHHSWDVVAWTSPERGGRFFVRVKLDSGSDSEGVYLMACRADLRIGKGPETPDVMLLPNSP